jgi:hypothetical protein
MLIVSVCSVSHLSPGPAAAAIIPISGEAEQRSPSAAFDLVVGGHTPGNDVAQARAETETFVEAGATWWCEFVLPGSGEADQALARIKQGPPR